MRLPDRRILFCLLTLSGLRSVQGKFGDVKYKVLDDETEAPTVEPTEQPIGAPPPPALDASVEGTCAEYIINSSNNWEPVYCEIQACPGFVTISQCYDAGSFGVAGCQGVNNRLFLLDNMDTQLATNGGVACGCPRIIYEFTLPCQTYRIKQTCDFYGADCSGTTSIVPFADSDDVTDNDDTSSGTVVTAAGNGGICDSYSIDQNSDQDVVCLFVACAPFVITQCTNDGYDNNFGNNPSPSGGSNNRIELYKIGDTTLLASDQNSGPCNGPKIIYEPTESGCINYKVRQICANGATDCGGRTAIYTPTVGTVVDASVGGVCDEFFLSNINGWAPVYCEFQACAGDKVTISQCPAGSAYCSDGTKLTLMQDNMVLASGIDAVCNCPKIVYTFVEACRRYRVKQEAILPELDVQGRTAIFLSTGTDDDAAEAPPFSSDGAGGLCQPWSMTGGVSSAHDVCLFESCGGSVTISQCSTDYTGTGTPVCSGSTKLTLVYEEDGITLATDQGSGSCLCSEIVYTLPNQCQIYGVHHACADGFTDCAGTTAVFATPPPTPIDVDSGGGLCAPFESVNGVGERYCPIESCGGSVTITQCPADYTGVGTPTCTGSTFLHLLTSGGGSIAYDEHTGLCGCSEIVYTLPNTCDTYQVFQICGTGEQNCAGTTAVFPTPPEVPPLELVNGGGLCTPFNLVSGGVQERYCEFMACGGPVVITQCPAEFDGTGTPSCTGDTTLSLHLYNGDLVSSATGSGVCGCPHILLELDLVCQPYYIKQTCSNGASDCSGVTGVSPPPPLRSEGAGGLCDAYVVDSSSGINSYTCDFRSCGGSVTISQCDDGYTGVGTPSCVEGNILALYFDGALLASHQSGDGNGPCDCPTIVYTFDNTCQMYQVVQECISGDCGGTTAVFDTPPPPPSSDGAGGLCPPFAVVGGIGETYCEFTSCGGSVTISQCGADYTGTGTPSCTGSTKIELYFDGPMLSSDESSGTCGCSEIVYTLPNVCETYRVKQVCGNGVTNCAGTTAVYSTPVPPTPPFDADNGGGLCQPFSIVNGVGEQDCSFTSCGGYAVITQCADEYLGAGTPVCHPNTMLTLYKESGELFSADIGSGSSCGCARMSLRLPSGCQTYNLKQTCSQGSTDCGGTTGVIVSSLIDDDDDSVVLRSDGVGGVCAAFDISARYLPTSYTCDFKSCGGSVTISQCAAGYSGAGTPSCFYGNKLELYDGATLLASAVSGDGTGPCSCPTLVYTLPSTCKAYQLVQKCVGQDCRGTTAVYATPVIAPPVVDDDVEVGTFVTAAGNGGICDPFSIDMSGDQDVACQFQACAAFIVTQCPDNYMGGGGTPTASGFNNKIELYRMDDPTTMLTVTGSSGPCGFPEFSYMPSDSGTCHTYKVRQTCYTVDCSGRTAIYTPLLSSAGAGGVCDPFSISGTDEQACSFQTCGGSVTISQCPQGYTGVGTPSCTSNSKLLLTYAGQIYAEDENSGSCGCPEIVYTLPNECKTYVIAQWCTDGVNSCSGTTAVYATPDAPPTPPPIDVDAGGGLCAPFNVVNGVGEQSCFFTFCGGDLSVTTCQEEYSGTGTVSCSGNTMVTLYQDGVLFSLDTGSGPCGNQCGHLLLYDIEAGCRNYELRQTCSNGATSCSGVTGISLIPPEDDDFPVGDLVYAAGAGGVCDFFVVSSRNGPAGVVCPFEACGGSVTISQCGEGYTGVGEPTCMDSPARLELYDGNTFLAADDDSGPCGCPSITYTFPTGCKEYKLKQVCTAGNGDCMGLTAIYSSAPVVPPPLNDICDEYTITSGGGVTSYTCEFDTCGGSVTITQCAEDYTGTGTPSCASGYNKLQLYDGATLLGSAVQGDGVGPCGCPTIVYTLPETCKTYEVIQTCAVGDDCGGVTAVFETVDPPMEVDFGGGLCDPFDAESGQAGVTCQFWSCGGSMTITQCPADYTGAGTPVCSGVPSSLMLSELNSGDGLAVNMHSGPCGCSQIKFTLPDVCRAYVVTQECAEVGQCAGTTAVFPTVINADSNIGGACTPFEVIDGVGERFCEFKSCGGSITMTQCPDDFPGDGTPSCDTGNRLELQSLAGAVLAFDSGSGMCDCPEIVYEVPDNGDCNIYRVKQTCVEGVDDCGGTTGVFPTPSNHDDEYYYYNDDGSLKSDGLGGLCTPFAVVDSVGEETCSFKSCGGQVFISQCPQVYAGWGNPTCSGDTRLELYFNGTFLAADENSGLCGCPEITYTFDNSSCQFYEVRQACGNGATDCSGTTAVFATPVPMDIDVAPGACKEFTIVNGLWERTCEFSSCGGSVTVTQCLADYPEYEYLYCMGNTALELILPGEGSLATDEGGGTCGCSAIVYTLPNVCQTYEVVQRCADGELNCQGTTGVTLTPHAPLDIDVDGGVVCESFEAVHGWEQQFCRFTSCGSTITMTQCPEDYTGNGSPTCEGETALFLMTLSGTMLLNHGVIGPCGCPVLVYSPTEEGCHSYRVGQGCVTSNGMHSCSGTTAVFSNYVHPVNEPLAGPSAPPTTLPTRYSTVAHTYTVRNGFAFAVPTPYGDLFTFGEAPHGGLMDGDVNFNSFTSPVSYIVASRFAFVAVLSDQTYVAWGAASALAGAVPGPVYGVVANEAAFAGISMTTWGVFAFGSKHNGGDVLDNARCNGFATQLSSLVNSLVASSCSFTALKSGGSVYTWGNPHCGGGISSETRTDLVNVQKVFATREAFAAILPGGMVKTWGGAFAGGDSTNVASALSTAEVVDIFANRNVFVAHTASGGLIAWGYGPHGGDMSAVQSNLNSNAVHVAFTFTACAALKDNGDVYVWGRADSGGDASSVAGGLHNIVSLYGNSKAFAAVNTTGGVVTWGKAEFGGTIPADKVVDLSSDVIEIFHTDRAFAALKQNGQLVVWGQAGHGGSPGPAIEALLLNGVHKVYSNDVGFAVAKEDGSVVAWGHPVSVPAPGVQLQSELLAIR